MPQFDVAGMKIEYVPISDMTLDELQQVTSDCGLEPPEAETALMRAHPGAWTAVLLVSARRADPGFVAERLGRLKLFEVIDQLYPDVEDDVDPPEESALENSSTAESPETSGNQS